MSNARSPIHAAISLEEPLRRVAAQARILIDLGRAPGHIQSDLVQEMGSIICSTLDELTTEYDVLIEQLRGRP